MKCNPPNTSLRRPPPPGGSGGAININPGVGGGAIKIGPGSSGVAISPKLTVEPRYWGECKGCRRICLRLTRFDEGLYCQELCMLKDRRRKRKARVWWGRISQRIANFVADVYFLHFGEV